VFFFKHKGHPSTTLRTGSEHKGIREKGKSKRLLQT